MGGLYDDPGGGQYHTMTVPTGSGSPAQQAPSGVDSSVNVGQTGGKTVNSHLDSFFDQSGWTREDVLVVAAMVQLLAWSVLLYLEVSDARN
ncbi:hypothetical protein ACFR9U_17185 [Halorientalis brevis]|uniref:Uncharacterized protein n=1 Tax=Halorientalis brevis TaxID=1126241 RepID=A0ABD6CGI2_9EURY|nr:hypothetical protein [Halorientalis brevis]